MGAILNGEWNLYDFSQIVDKSQENYIGVVLFRFQGADYLVIGSGPDLVVQTE